MESLTFVDQGGSEQLLNDPRREPNVEVATGLLSAPPDDWSLRRYGDVAGVNLAELQE